MAAGGQPQTAIAALDVVLFGVGAWRIGVEAGQVRASRAPAPGERGPAALAAVLDLPAEANPANSQVLVVKAAAGDREFRVAGPVDLHPLPAACIHPLPTLLAARCRLPGLRAIAIEDGRLMLLIDLVGCID